MVRIFIFFKQNKNFEQKIGDFLVDGYDKESNTVYQFHGCYWHGHEACFTSGTYNRVNKKTMGYIYREHLKKEIRLKILHLMEKKLI